MLSRVNAHVTSA